MIVRPPIEPVAEYSFVRMWFPLPDVHPAVSLGKVSLLHGIVGGSQDLAIVRGPTLGGG